VHGGFENTHTLFSFSFPPAVRTSPASASARTATASRATRRTRATTRGCASWSRAER
jgi:hypothetical protein